MEAKQRKDDSTLDGFSIYIISRGRPANVKSMQHHLDGLSVTWVVREEEITAYKAAGAMRILEGGSLCQSRNIALQDAFNQNLVCVQLDDDLVQFRWWTMNGFEQIRITTQNAIMRTFKLMKINNLYLGGAMPTTLVHRSHLPAEPEFQTINFISAAFMVVRPTRLRFNEEMTLKEDYDYTVQHIKEYGGVLRVRQLMCRSKKHKVKQGGGGAEYRTPEIERENITRLELTHPGWWRKGRNENEVILYAPDDYRPQNVAPRIMEHITSTHNLLCATEQTGVCECDDYSPYWWV